VQYDFHEHLKGFKKDSFERFILVGDVGGTNTRLGMVGLHKGNLSLVFQLCFNSAEIELIPAMNETLRFAKEKYDIETHTAAFGIPGQVSPDRQWAEPTHLKWGKVVAREILNNSFLQHVFLLNDFEALSFGLEALHAEDPAELLSLEHGNHYVPRPVKYGTKLVLGAGTGLGEAFMVFDPHRKKYVPSPSEGGHAALPTQSPLELEFEEFVQKELKVKTVTYEHAISGPGLVMIFNFLKKQRGFKETDKTKAVDGTVNKPPLIMEHSKSDPTCKKSVELFLYFFAKCAQNKALEFLPVGGLYITGGIAQHHPDVFTRNGFVMDFELGSDKSQLLKEVPLFLVTEPHVALLGAASAAVHFPLYAVSK